MDKTEGDQSYTGLRVERSARGRSLFEYLAGGLLISDEEARDLIDFGSVQVNGRQERAPEKALEGVEEIRVYWPRGGTKRHYEADPARVIYRDRHLLAYDKEAGIPSQQTPYDGYNNLFAALYRMLEREGKKSPYVALHHRLDQETSGVMLFALDRAANLKLGKSFEQHEIEKDYLAWVEGSPRLDQWTSSEDIGRKAGRYMTCPQGKGKRAETDFEVLFRGEGQTLVRARPKTGRTHQIRLHLKAAGHPIVGDRIYGNRSGKRLYLHAHRLVLAHPVTGKELTVIAPLPPDWPREAACPD
ncbi:MAG: RluA family pseudouridine synthase [Acidobacteriota bacterium]